MSRVGLDVARNEASEPDAARTPAEWRAFYEDQGYKAIASGVEMECSTAPIIEAVRRMASDPRWTFRTVLDVGCGANLSYAAHLSANGKLVVGVDFTWPFLAVARGHGRDLVVQGDATRLPFPDGSFDAVVCSETLEHIPDDRSAVDEIRRVLRPGGLLFLTVPNYLNAARVLAGLRRTPGYRNLQVGHLREYSRRQVDDLLKTGFAIQARYHVPFHWRGPVGLPVDWLIRSGLLGRLSLSWALVAERASK